MILEEFKKLINSIPEEYDNFLVLLPEGYHLSDNITYRLEIDNNIIDGEGELGAIIFRCD